MADLLDVEHLAVTFRTEEGVVRAVDDVSFTLGHGELLGIVGESGSGKSVTAMTLMGLTRSPNATFAGTAMLGDLDLVSASEQQLEHIRGRRVAMIFQDPMTALPSTGSVSRSWNRSGPTSRSARRRPRPGPSTFSTGSASREPGSGPGAIRTSSPAVCANAS
jgi:ABC-type dipeptide/oligopeptide/nickel transport system ATPase component